MINPRYAVLLLAVVLMLLSGCSLPTGGAGGETTNGLITGSVKNDDGSSAAAVMVRLFPSDYDPVKNTVPVLTDTTDSMGNYSFSPVTPGEYAVEATMAVKGKNALALGIYVAEDTITAPPCTLGVPGTIRVMLPPGSNGTSGYLYIPGTDLFIFLNDNTDSAVLDSVPAGIIPGVCYASTTDTPFVVIRYDIPVSSGSTTNVYNPLWNYARQLVLNTTPDGADIAGDVMNFPVLIRLTSADFDFSQAKGDGSDIRFAKTEGTSLHYEIEAWDAVRADAAIWVSVDTVFGNNNTQSLTMYWGNPDAPGASEGTAVFDTSAGFQGVWHLSLYTGSDVVDATANGYNGTPQGSTPPGSAQGIIGNANSFTGAGFIEMPGTAGSTLNFPEHGTYSMSAWVYLDSLTDDYEMIASKGDKQYNLQYKGTTGNWQFTEYQDTTGWDETASGAVAGIWVYLVGVRSDVKQYLYVNGVCTDSVIFNLLFSPSDTSYAERQGYRNTASNFMIGKKVDYADWFFRGAIDEVRVVGKARSPDWIKLCYMNQKSPDMLVVVQQ